MKKLFMTALLAFLVGGFALTANAQKPSETTKDDEAAAQVKKIDPNVAKYAEMLKNFETAVNECVVAYKESLVKEKTADKSPKDFEKKLKAALKIQGELDKVEKRLSEKQLETFKKLKEELAKVNTTK